MSTFERAYFVFVLVLACIAFLALLHMCTCFMSRILSAAHVRMAGRLMT